jgi:uncharacterized protein (TIGR00661 family)
VGDTIGIPVKILYGICGHGMGHAMRSAVVAKHLEQAGHDLLLMSSGGSLDYLAKRWPGRTAPIVGFGAAVAKNKVSVVDSLLKNVRIQERALGSHVVEFLTAQSFAPDLVISDFDPWTARYATLLAVPLVAVDNFHFLSRCTHEPSIVASDRFVSALLGAVVQEMIPRASHYFVTTFVYAPPSKPNTSLHLPILRDEIVQAKSAVQGDHVVVYFNNKADHVTLIRGLEQVGVPCRVYGLRVKEEMHSSNVTVCPFSDEGFIRDLATSRAVVGGAGFTLMTEAIHLGKPMLAIPFDGQAEQILNANYLARLGWGERCAQLTPDALRGFLDRSPAYAERLRTFVHDGNAELFRSIDARIAALSYRQGATG